MKKLIPLPRLLYSSKVFCHDSDIAGVFYSRKSDLIGCTLLIYGRILIVKSLESADSTVNIRDIKNEMNDKSKLCEE